MSGDAKMRGRRALARLSMRAIKRAPLRSLLIIILIALMVAIGSMVATVDRTDRITAQDQIDGELGEADLMVSVALTSGGAPWGIFGSPDLPFGSGVCTTMAGPDGSSMTSCEGPFPPPLGYGYSVLPEPICPPGVDLCNEKQPELTPEQQAVIDEFDEWSANFDPQAAATAMSDLLAVDVTVIREARSFESQPRSPFASALPVESLTDIDIANPLNNRSLRLVEGRAPTSLNEIALSVDRYSSDPAPIGSTVQVGEQPMVLVGRVARAGFPSSPGHWGVVTPETLDASPLTVAAARFRIDGIDSTDSPLRLNSVLPTIERLIGDQPIYAATDRFLAAPVGLSTWSIVQRDVAGEFNRGNNGQAVAVAIGTTALTGLIGLQVILVIATAFTVGRRRRSREFGQLITVGADARHLRRLALTEGFLLGLLGAALGIAAGLVLTSIGVNRQWWGDGNPFQAGVRFSPVDWIGPVVVGIAAAALAAWWPVRRIADAPLADGALADVPAARPAAYIPKLGALLAIGGVIGLGAITVVSRSLFYAVGPLAALCAILATMLGLLVLIGTILSWFGRRADGLPLLARLVVRNADRHRSRSWLVVGAFILTIGIPIAIGAAIEAYPNSFGARTENVDEATFSLHTQSLWRGGGAAVPDTAEWTDEQIEAYELEAGISIDRLKMVRRGLDEFVVAFTARAPEIVGELETAPIVAVEGTELVRTAGSSVNYSGGVVAIATAELFDFARIDRSLINQLNTTKALTTVDLGGQATGQLVQWDSQASSPFGPPLPPTRGPNYLALQLEYAGSSGQTLSLDSRISAIISAELAESIGASTAEIGLLFRADAEVTDDQVVELRALADEIWWQTIDADIAPYASNGVYLSTVAGRSSDPSPATVRWIVAAIAAAVAALIALTTSALTAVESEPELESLIATGARPSIRRRFLGAQALYHLGLAALLATPTTIIVYWVAVQADEYGPRSPVVPWLSILLSSIVMPLLVAGLIFALFRNGRPAISRRAT